MFFAKAVCVLLGDTPANPAGNAVMEALSSGWLKVAEDLPGHGCHVEPAALAIGPK